MIVLGLFDLNGYFVLFTLSLFSNYLFLLLNFFKSRLVRIILDLKPIVSGRNSEAECMTDMDYPVTTYDPRTCERRGPHMRANEDLPELV